MTLVASEFKIRFLQCKVIKKVFVFTVRGTRDVEKPTFEIYSGPALLAQKGSGEVNWTTKGLQGWGGQVQHSRLDQIPQNETGTEPNKLRRAVKLGRGKVGGEQGGGGG